jgi:hypothetical protein
MGFNDRGNSFRGGNSGPREMTKVTVLTAVLRPKSRLNQLKDDRFTAENVFLITGNSNDDLG